MMGTMLRTCAAVAALVLACGGTAAAAERAATHKPVVAKAAQTPKSVPAKPEAAVDLAALQARAEAGDVAAQVQLGEVLHEGRGIARDAAAAAGWFGKAATQGSPQGKAALALLYLNGSGVEADPAQAAKLMREAAEQGFAPASYNLGLMYLKGLGVAADRGQALTWLGKAADAKHAEAQYMLGVLSVSRDAPKRDGVEAVKWLSLAATHGDEALRAKAMAQIKVISQAIGPGPTQDGLEAARRWFYSHS